MIESAGQSPTSNSAFLDTNALLNLFWLWEVCNAAEVKLDVVTDWSMLKGALHGKKRFAAQLSADDANGVKAGLHCFRHLRNSVASYQYYTSIVCRAEMHHVLLRSLGLDRLIRRGIPSGLRVKRPQILYRRALQSRDYRKIRNDLSDFFESLRLDYGLDIMEVERPSIGVGVAYQDVWVTAEEVWSRVLIDVMDSYIYAAAVEIDADAFVTSDGSLFEVLHNLCSPKNEWVSLTISLKRALKKPQSVSLPKPIKPSTPLPP